MARRTACLAQALGPFLTVECPSQTHSTNVGTRRPDPCRGAEGPEVRAELRGQGLWAGIRRWGPRSPGRPSAPAQGRPLASVQAASGGSGPSAGARGAAPHPWLLGAGGLGGPRCQTERPHRSQRCLREGRDAHKRGIVWALGRLRRCSSSRHVLCRVAQGRGGHDGPGGRCGGPTFRSLPQPAVRHT